VSERRPAASAAAFTRRSFVRRSAALAALPLGGGMLRAAAAAAAADVRAPDSLPDPTRPAGTATAALPFDHIVVVMMENHSFDNILGALSRSGQQAADGLTFNGHGKALNSNPSPNGPVVAFPFASTAQRPSVSQSWNATHRQIDGGRMDGFVASVNSRQPMGYWTESVLPFAYSLARTFTVANRWFCSAPCPTFPNRRFLLAATAYGNVATTTASLKDPAPPNGTIFDRLSAYGISWRNYFNDLPMTAVIPSIVKRYPNHLATFSHFKSACRAGTLPAVSFVDPRVGVLSTVGSMLAGASGVIGELAKLLGTTGGTEEDPQNMGFGENWAYSAVEAVLHSPAWPRTLLIYTYDEHGGYYDHVPPPAAIAPDSIPPQLAVGDIPGGYDIYGPRVPAVVVSPYSKPNGTTDVVHDHTSVLATIEAKWNLPALTYRDANAATVLDFLDTSTAALLKPPTIARPLPAP
jgi:phospholipase C